VIVGSEIMCDKILNYLLSNNHQEKEEMVVEEEEVKSDNDMNSQSQPPSHDQSISIKFNSKVFEMKHEGGLKDDKVDCRLKKDDIVDGRLKEKDDI